MINYEEKYKYYLKIFERELEKYLSKISDIAYQNLFLAMQYSLLAGGKRVRPVLMLSTAEEIGLDLNIVLPYAVAIEMIHTYSLIHDDLPCMDNDDLRRGKPTNHKVFGEGNAVLAGDGLLNYAYEICFDECLKGTAYVKAAKILSVGAGIGGMISGQAADLHGETLNNADEVFLKYIHINKTTKLLQSALLIPLCFTGGQYTENMKIIGEKIGLIFQYTDDIIDAEGNSKEAGKTCGKDFDSNKLTIIKLKGLEKSKKEVQELYSECIKQLNEISPKFEFLTSFTTKLINRKH